MTKVSVIIPTFNRRDLVCETIDSVLGQTLPDVEVVVVDDGSTDGTGEHLASCYSNRIRYVYQFNSGRSVARNRGVQMASGEYLLFLDSDDLLLPHALERMASFLGSHPDVDAVYTDCDYMDADGRKLQTISLERPPVTAETFLEMMVLTNVIVACHSLMLRKQALERIGFPYFDETLHGPEDHDLWLRLAVNGAIFRELEELTCLFRLHGGNTLSPIMPSYQRAMASLRRFKQKVLEADFFPSLSMETQYQFLYTYLTFLLRGDPEAQATLFDHSRFKALPSQMRARLRYYTAVDNIMEPGHFIAGQRQLDKAIQEDPCLQYRVVYALSHLGKTVVRTAINVRRWWGNRRREPDYSIAPHVRSDVLARTGRTNDS